MLTREEIEKMPAGAELDVLVHEQVLGLCAHSFEVKPCTAHDDPEMNMYESMAKCECDSDYPTKQCVKCGIEASGLAYQRHYTGPKYSADIAAAKQVQTKLFEQGWGFEIYHGHNSGPHPFLVIAARFDFPSRTDITHYGEAETEALAICRAALLAPSAGATPITEEGKPS